MQRRHPQNPGRFTTVHARRACSLGIVYAPSKAISHRECVRGEPLEFYSGEASLRREPHTPAVKVPGSSGASKAIAVNVERGGAALQVNSPMPEGRGICAARSL